MTLRSWSRSSSFENDEPSSRAGLLSEKLDLQIVPSAKSWVTPRVLSDFTIGLSDGLTVPFALTAGLSALGDGKVVVSAGLAELVAGSISMGVAGYLAAKGELDAQISSSQMEHNVLAGEPEEALSMIRERFQEYQLPEDILDSITNHYANAEPLKILQTLTRFENNENATQLVRPWLTGMTIAIAYLFGGFVPLLPYFFTTIHTAFTISVFITATVLFSFGWAKVPLAASKQGLRKCLRSGLEMLLLGGLAAAAALICVKGLNVLSVT